MYGAETPKRQWAWSNSPAITKLDVGWKRMKAKYATCEKYKNKKGQVRYKGTARLKQTEQPDYKIACLSTVCRHYPDRFGDALVRLRPELIAASKCCLNDMPPKARYTLMNMPQDNIHFETADLLSVVKYLRYGNSLDIPSHWKEILPRP